MKKMTNNPSAFYNQKYFIYIIRIISWITIGAYAYFGFSNLEYFAEHYGLSIIFLLALFGIDYKVKYSKSFFKRVLEILLQLLLVALVFYSMYLIVK